MQFRRIGIGLCLSAVLLATALGGCGGDDEEPTGGGSSEGAAEAKPVEWDYMLYLGPTHPMAKLAIEYAETVRTETDGSVDITVRPAGELPYTGAEVLQYVGDGTLAMGDAAGAFIAGQCQVANLSGLPFLVTSLEEQAKVREVLKPYVDKCFEGFGVRTLYEYTYPNIQVFGSGDPPSGLADLDGKKMRQQGPELGAVVESFGAEGITLETAEVPSAVQRGLMDALLTGPVTADGSGWGDFLDWMYKLDIGLTPSYVVVNIKTFDGLADDQKEALERVAEEFAQKSADEMFALDDEALSNLQSKANLKVVEATPEEKAKVEAEMKAYWEKWADTPELKEALGKVREALGK